MNKVDSDRYFKIISDIGLDRIPDDLRESIFEKLFATAEIAKFNQEEYQAYEDSLKYYRDLKNSIDYAKEMAKNEERIEIAKNLLESGVDNEIIIKSTGLTEEEIKKLQC